MNENNRIGMLIPPPNITLEKELLRYMPSEISLHWNRVPRSNSSVTVASLREMTENTVTSAQILAMANVSLLVFACTSGSFILGRGWDDEINNRLTKKTQVPAITTSTAVLQALSVMNVSEISLATPYIKEILLIDRFSFFQKMVLMLFQVNVSISAKVLKFPPFQVQK